MTTYTVYGASDDLVEIEGTDGTREELSALGDDSARVIFGAPDGRAALAVIARYEAGGVWSVSPVPVNEDTAIPEGWTWTVARGAAAFPGPSRYTMVLTIDTGDDEATLLLPPTDDEEG